VLLALYPVVKLATAQPKAQPSLLFVQIAQKIDYKKSGPQSGVMTLYDVPSQTMSRCSKIPGAIGDGPSLRKKSAEAFVNQREGSSAVPAGIPCTVRIFVLRGPRIKATSSCAMLP
jgi:hypothetical protein